MSPAVVPDPGTETEALLRALRRASGVAVVTGAGVSLASGIPTFRGPDPGAVWRKDVTDLGTHRYFREDPAGSWQWYLSRFDGLGDRAPNATHHALVEIERQVTARGARFALISQNVDPLHERAGACTLYKVHGTAARVRCSTEQGCEYGAPRGSLPFREEDFAAFRADPSAARIPTCPACGAPLRPHILWFDEFYTDHEDYAFGRALWAARHAAVVIFVGTSFSVAITDLVLRKAREGSAEVFSVDPHHAPPEGVRWLMRAAEEAFPALAALLPMAAPT